MKTEKNLVISALIVCLFFFGAIAQIEQPRVSWFDDFLGVRVNQAYSQSFAGTGAIQIADDTAGSSGIVLLAAMGSGSGAARLRLGEDPITGSPFNALSFSARKNLVYQSRVFLNCNSDVSATIGLIGYSDPKNVIALIYGTPEGHWMFEVTNDGNRTFLDTGFRHEPGKWFTVKITTEWGETPAAKIYINDNAEPLAVVTGEFVPPGGLCPEFQIWNRPLDDAYSQPTMYVDYLSVSQDR